MTTLILHPDLDCEVYIDTELHGLAKAGEDYTISLERGAYWIECVSPENEADRTDFDFRTDGSDFTEHHSVEIKPIRYKRIVSQYDYIGEFQCGFAEVQKRGKTIGYINCDGDLIYDDKTFDEVLHFGSDTICVCINKKSRYDKGLWGILNSAGKYVVEPQFNYIKPIEFGLAIFSKDKKYGLINTAGEIVTLTQYDRLHKIDGAKLILCKLNGKYGLLNYEGYKITPLKYDEILPYKEGLARIKLNNKYGFLDTAGNEVIPCIYDYAHNFSGNLAKVCIKDWLTEKWGYINNKGEILTPCKYTKIANFGEDIENLARVECDGRYYGYIDYNGKEIIPCKYSDIEWSGGIRMSRIKIPDIKGLIKVRIGGTREYCGEWPLAHYGYIDYSGNEIIPCKYDKITHGPNGSLKVCIDGRWECEEYEKNLTWRERWEFRGGKWSFMRQLGNEIVPCKYDDIGWFKEGVSIVKFEGKFGLINEAYNEVLPCQYDYIRDFSDGMAAVLLDGKWGFVDKSGTIKVPIKYSEVNDYYKGYAEVIDDWKDIYIDKNGTQVSLFIYKLNTKRLYFYEGLAAIGRQGYYGYVDENGRKIIPLIYTEVRHFSEGLAAVKKNGRWGYVDKIGKEVIPFKYYFAGDFYEGLARVQLDFLGGYRFINYKGDTIIRCGDKYEYAGDFSEGVARVKHSWSRDIGFIDKTGKEVIPCKYHDARDFRNGLAKVKLYGEKFQINRTGVKVKDDWD